MRIDIEFDVFKALTLLRENEADDFSAVIRRLLRSAVVDDSLHTSLSDIVSEAEERPHNGIRTAVLQGKGYLSRGLFLPDGTKLKAIYKGRCYGARIAESRWLDGDDQEHSSPSAAARAITGNSVNGLRFWEAMRPGDNAWRKLDVISASKQ